MHCVTVSSGENPLVAYISCMLLGIGSVITFTSAVGFLGILKEIKCLLVIVSVNQTPTFSQNEKQFCVHKNCDPVLMWCPYPVLNKSADRKVFFR